MKALVKAKAERGIWMEDIETPHVGHNDVLIKVKRTAICGTDIHIFKWDDWAQATIPVPMAVGHEFSGEIVDMGVEVRGFEIGDRVSAEGHITCGYCRNCRAGRRHLCMNTVGVGVNRPGAFAEYLSVPAFNAFKLPDAITDDMASILDPLGNATHTALSFDLVGEDVLITGAGPIGIMAVAIARYAGARHVVITDVNDYRDDDRRNHEGTRHGRGLRRWHGDVGQPTGFRRHAPYDAPWRQGRDSGHPTGRHGHRLERRDFQGTDSERCLWPRDVRDLVQDVEHAAERSQHGPDHHTPL
jgi:threonine 3-dehydrogenase